MAEPTVVRLKELLFDKESRELDTLARRLEALGTSARAERAELEGRLAELQHRHDGWERLANDEDRFRDRVARVLDASIREAEKSKHRELSSAMAPMVVRTFRSELRSEATQEELTKTLYPKLGEMVKKYIASAMRDLMDGINRRLESGLMQSGLVLKLRSMATGRSMAELALADTQIFRVEEIYLIRRGSGELVHHWTREPRADRHGAGSNRDTLVSGFLTAITAFAEEAFAADGSSLRALDLDDHRIYLRASPAQLVAAKCSGTAPASLEQVLDQGLIDLVGRHNQIEAANPPDAGPAVREAAAAAHEALLVDVSQSLESTIAAGAAKLREERRSLRPLKIALLVLGLPLLAYVGWQLYVSHVTRQLQAAVDAVIAAEPQLSGYPVGARVERGGEQIWVSGLAPTGAVRERLLAGLRAAAPDAQLKETVGVLPTADLDGALAAERLRAVVDSAKRRLDRLASDLERASRSGTGEGLAAIEAARSAANAAAAELGAVARGGRSEEAAPIGRVHETIGRIRAATDRIAVAQRSSGAGPAASRLAGLPSSLAGSIEELAASTEQLGLALALAEQAQAQAVERARLTETIGSLGREIEALRQAQRTAAQQPEVAALARRLDGINLDKSPREQLETFIRANAVFFGNGSEYRNPDAAARTLEGLAALARPVDVLVRVVGYTDELGGGANARNLQLSQQRAEKVLEDLVNRGIPRQRLVAVGRATALDLAPRTGGASPSRRVEFEIGFEGEEAPAP